MESHLNQMAEAAMERRAAEVAGLNKEAHEKRQIAIRVKILASIRGLPTQRGPLNPPVMGGFDRPGYRVENLVFESLPKFHVTANLYLPKGGKAPYPAVVGVAG